jgi:hypothetical protein
MARIEDAPHLEDRHRGALLIGLAAMPDGDRLCHGDLHPLNILGDVDKPMIVDWPDACRGDPAADVCCSYVLLTLHASELAAPYLHAYCRLGKIFRQAILDWLPYVPAAKLAERVPGENRRTARDPQGSSSHLLRPPAEGNLNHSPDTACRQLGAGTGRSTGPPHNRRFDPKRH